jgi:NAD(P)-dependent dehydrogenase (short-subunit alcohol dehydrogenase family)
MNAELQGKVALITGGNTGIGKQTAIALARKGAQVVITSRDPDKGQAALAEIREASGRDDVVCMRLDLASLAEVRRFAAEFLERHPRLDVLVLNAGLMLGARSQTVDGFESTFGVNHLGHFALTRLLLDRLKQSGPARIVVLSSQAHRGARGLDFDDLQLQRGYSSWKAYTRSKLANLLFTLELAERLEGTGVTVNAAHPGVVATEFAGADDMGRFAALVWSLGKWAMLTPEQGARTSVYLASSPEVEGVSGKYFIKSKPARTTRAAQDREAARRLWDVSEALTGERY